MRAGESAEVGRRLEDLVEWQVDRMPVRRKAVGMGKLVLGTAFGVGLGGGAVGTYPGELMRVTVPAADDEPVETLHASGTAPWLPADLDGGVLVELYRARALATLPGGPVEMPLRSLRVESATCRQPGRARQADTPWCVTAVGPGTRLDLVGTWIALAWAGHLAGWPEPTHRADG